jgi:hypothetical protein
LKGGSPVPLLLIIEILASFIKISALVCPGMVFALLQGANRAEKNTPLHENISEKIWLS